MSALLQDLRQACRALLRQPAWTCAAVLCLAVGIGPNTAAFSIVNGLLLRPLPFPDADALVMVAVHEREESRTRPWSWAEHRAVAPGLGEAGALSVRTFAPVALAAGDEARMVQAELVAANYFEVLQVRPAAGRLLRPGADGPDAPHEAVISHALWRQRFAGDPSIVGRIVRINSHPVTVVGVAPAGFAGLMQIVAADLWMPAPLGRLVAGLDETAPQFGAVARLGPGVSRAQLQARLDVLLAAHGAAVAHRRTLSSVTSPATGFGVPPALRTVVVSASALLAGIMALVTGIAIANVASLMLARAADRRREMGVRIALGAGAWPLVRQVAAESAVLAAAGAAAGFVLAVWVLRALAALAPESGQPEHIAFAIDVTPDLRVLAYAVAAAIGVAVLCGLVPARTAARTDVVDALKGSAGAGRAPAAARGLMVIVVGQIAVSTTLLVGAGLLVRTYLNTLTVAPGIETRGLSAVSLDLTQIGVSAEAGRRLLDDAVRRIERLPGVERAALTRDRPLSFSGRDVSIADDAQAGTAVRHEAGGLIVSPEYFAMLGIDLVAGRVFSANGESGAVAIVNETMARRVWPGRSPLGRRFRLPSSSAPIEVVGVARDVKYRSLTEAPRAVFYRPWAQDYSPSMSVIVRARPGAVVDVRTIAREARSVHADLAIVEATTLDEQMRARRSPRRQSALFLLAVCGLGLFMSSVGLYGVMTYSVRRRVRELGIRLALGAAPRDVVAMVLRQGLRLMAAGLAIGLAVAAVATRAIERFLYGVSGHDPATLAGAAAVLLAVTLAALYLPARWATRVAPTVALRED